MLPLTLGTAIRNDDAETVRAWLDGEGDAGVTTAEGDSLVSLAARHGALRVVDLLLRRGAPVDAFGVWPSALVQAVEAGHLEVVDRLLAAGADVGSEPWHEDADLPLFSAVHFRRWAIADRLLAAGSVAVADPPWLDEVLGAALEAKGRQRSDFVADLVVRALERFGAAPLPIAPRLLQRAAKLLSKSPQTRELADRLAAQVDDARALEDELILLYGEDERPQEAMQRVREAPPELRIRLAAALLPQATVQGCWEDAEELLSFAEGKIDRRDPMGRTALMYAAWLKNGALVYRLVERGAGLRRVDDTEDEAVIDWALLGGDADVIDFLRRRLAETAGRVDRAVDARLSRLDPEQRSLDASHAAVDAAAETRWERVESLLMAGAKINGRGRRDRTLLIYAARWGDRDRIAWLVDRGADLDVRARNGENVDDCARLADPSGDLAAYVQELRGGRR